MVQFVLRVTGTAIAMGHESNLRVDYVHMVGTPFTESGGTLDCNSFLSLQVHTVHFCPYPILTAHVVNSINTASVKKYSLC